MKPTKKTILVADDDLAILESIQLLLEINDYTVVTTTGEDLLNLTFQHNPDIILIDLWMGALSGQQLCQELRGKEEFSNLPIILVSASSEIKDTYQEIGATDFIEKPFDIDVLIEKIEMLS